MDDSEYIGNRLLIFTAVFLPLQIVCVGLRYLTLYFAPKSWGWDDLVIFVALAEQLAMAAIAFGLLSLDYLATKTRTRLTTQHFAIQNRLNQIWRGWLSPSLSRGYGSLKTRNLGEASGRHRVLVLRFCKRPQVCNSSTLSPLVPTAHGRPSLRLHYDGIPCVEHR